MQDWRKLPNTHLAYGPDSEEGLKALLDWVQEQCPKGKCLRVVVESTGQLSKRFARALRGKGLPEVAIINPHRSKAFADSLGVREKSDRIDCATLALYAMVHRCEATEPGSSAEENLRELTRLREGYLKDLTLWKNRLRETDQSRSRKIVEETIKHLEKQIEELDEAIEQEIAGDEKMAFQVKALKQVTGIKQVASSTMTAELGELHKYERNQIIGRVGVYARRFESGSSVHKRPRLAKGGCPRVRRVLYMAATSILNSKGPLREYAEGLRKRGLSDMSVIMALMRKLLLICRAVMINGGNYDESKILRGAKS